MSLPTQAQVTRAVKAAIKGAHELGSNAHSARRPIASTPGFASITSPSMCWRPTKTKSPRSR